MTYGAIETQKGSVTTAPLSREVVAVNEDSCQNAKQKRSTLAVRCAAVVAVLAIVGLAISTNTNVSKTFSLDVLSASREMELVPTISKRGQSIKPVRDDGALMVKGAADPYHPSDNPDGYLVMLVAENKLMWGEMAKKLEEIQATKPLPEWIFTYNPPGGNDEFKETLAGMMQRWIHAPIDPQYLRFQSGAGSVIDQVACILADANDGVLLNGPGYSAFPGDFNVYAHAKVHVIETYSSNKYAPTVEDLEDGYNKAVAAGNPPKIYVICQPNNPTGNIYPKETMELMMHWALGKGLHVISDEIYALSTHPGYTTTSAADVMYGLNSDSEKYLGDHVHVIAGLSKDWGMSGFRVGSLFSHNQALLDAIDLVGYYQTVSAYTQHALIGVFEDDDFVDWYIKENRNRLYTVYKTLEEELKRIDVPLYESQGAIFAWADFSAYLLEGQTEKELWMELFNDAKVAFTSGESMYGDKPGLFRVVFGWPEGGVLAIKELGNRLVQWKADRAATLK